MSKKIRLPSEILKFCMLSLFVFSFCLTTKAQVTKAFYVGHSLSDQIPDMVQSLSNDHEAVDFSWVYQSIPGSPLRYNWERKLDQSYGTIDPHYYGFYDDTYGLPSGTFDALVLTESVPRHIGSIEWTYEYADSFYHYANTFNPDIQVYLYEDWHCVLSGTPAGCDYDVDSNPWRQRLSDDLPMWESVVDTLNARYNPSKPVCLIPAAQGLAALYDSIEAGVIPDLNQIEDIFSDNIHLTDVGKYFVACIHFATIHKTSPVGLTNQTQVWWGGDFEAPGAELALKMQEIAWETAVNYPRSCIDVAPTGVSELSETIFISPNPTSDQFTIKGIEGKYMVRIFDATGKETKPSLDLEGTSQVNIADLPPGIYFVKIMDSDNLFVGFDKVVKR